MEKYRNRIDSTEIVEAQQLRNGDWVVWNRANAKWDGMNSHHFQQLFEPVIKPVIEKGEEVDDNPMHRIGYGRGDD